VWADPTWRSRLDPYYNGAILHDRRVNGAPYPGVRTKHYLVPVTSASPFVRWLFRAIPGAQELVRRFYPRSRLPLYKTGWAKFGVIRVYESAFEDLPRK